VSIRAAYCLILGDFAAVDSADGPTIRRFAGQTVTKKAELVSTNEHAGYLCLECRRNFPHQMVTHKQGPYVRCVVHMSSIDGFWSLSSAGVSLDEFMRKTIIAPVPPKKPRAWKRRRKKTESAQTEI